MKKIVKKAKRMVDILLEDGSEKLDPKPVVSQIKTGQPLTIQQQVRQLVNQQLAAAAEAEGFESPDDADDFNVGDDYDPESPYEYNFDPAISSDATDFVEEVPTDGESASNTGDNSGDSGNGESDTKTDTEEEK
jgi:hypothetical protein